MVDGAGPGHGGGRWSLMACGSGGRSAAAEQPPLAAPAAALLELADGAQDFAVADQHREQAHVA